MTSYIILLLCIIVIVAYIFDITSKYTKIPSVILLIALGIAMQWIDPATKLKIPNLQPLLHVIGTIGLILIIMEASLDLKIERKKSLLILKSISSALGLFILFSIVFTYIMVNFYGYSIRDSLLNGIPLGIISSSVAIPSSVLLHSDEKEFIVYESSFSDIIGIILFDFILINHGSIGSGILNFGLSSLLTLVVAVLLSSALAFLLHKIKYHINYVIIMASVVLVYVLAKLSHLPALLLVLIFGLVLSNNQMLRHTFVNKVFDFQKFRGDLESFKKIVIELTFLVRSFFFIMFGYYTKVEGLFGWKTLIIGVIITAGIFLFRMLFLKYVLRMKAVPLVFFSPRGLITILLFLSIPDYSRISLIGEEIITIVILMTIFVLMIGNMIYRKGHKQEDDKHQDITEQDPYYGFTI